MIAEPQRHLGSSQCCVAQRQQCKWSLQSPPRKSGVKCYKRRSKRTEALQIPRLTNKPNLVLHRIKYGYGGKLV